MDGEEDILIVVTRIIFSFDEEEAKLPCVLTFGEIGAGGVVRVIPRVPTGSGVRL
jgi:hypothetical protein